MNNKEATVSLGHIIAYVLSGSGLFRHRMMRRTGIRQYYSINPGTCHSLFEKEMYCFCIFQYHTRYFWKLSQAYIFKGSSHLLSLVLQKQFVYRTKTL